MFDRNAVLTLSFPSAAAAEQAEAALQSGVREYWAQLSDDELRTCIAELITKPAGVLYEVLTAGAATEWANMQIANVVTEYRRRLEERELSADPVKCRIAN